MYQRIFSALRRSVSPPAPSTVYPHAPPAYAVLNRVPGVTPKSIAQYTAAYLSAQDKVLVRKWLIAAKKEVENGNSLDFLLLESQLKAFFPNPFPWELNDLWLRLKRTGDFERALNHVATHSALERNMDRLYISQRLQENPKDGYLTGLNYSWKGDMQFRIKKDWTQLLGKYKPDIISPFYLQSPTNYVIAPTRFLQFSGNAIMHSLPKHMSRFKVGECSESHDEELDALLNIAWPGHLLKSNQFAMTFEYSTPPPWIAKEPWVTTVLKQRHAQHNHSPWVHINERMRRVVEEFYT